MNEEQVTKRILNWLIDNGWEIICFDFPQSGTGHFLRPNGTKEKNKDTINPDIVAVKNNKCVFFEDKDRYYYQDYLKQNELITNNNYTDSISVLLTGYDVDKIYYGIGLPTDKHDTHSKESATLVDFIVGVNKNNTVDVLFSSSLIFE